MISLVWDDEAQCELNCSALYYAKREDAELAERFVQAVEDAITEVRASPAMHRSFRGSARRVKVARFPYTIVYTFDEAQSIIRIIAVAHSSRDPGYWTRRVD